MNATSRSSLINPSHTLHQRLQGRRIKTSSLRRLDSLYLYRRFRNLHIRRVTNIRFAIFFISSTLFGVWMEARL